MRHNVLRRLLLAGFILLSGLALLAVLVSQRRPGMLWPDRRPIGALFLASHAHASPLNPRGWFNQLDLDVRGPEGAKRFRIAALEYAHKSITLLRRTNAQGVLVWDLEGEEFPHKTTYIGDPTALNRLAPEMSVVADEFFAMFRNAGLKIGLTVRPQELVFDHYRNPEQRNVGNYESVLTRKIDYARRRWGATMFYIDSNRGVLGPWEWYRLRRLALSRPDILLIPEHHSPLYYAFSAPYGSMQRGDGPTPWLVHLLFPNAFRVLAIPDNASAHAADLTADYRSGDVLVFPAWFDGGWIRLISRLSSEMPDAGTGSSSRR